MTIVVLVVLVLVWAVVLGPSLLRRTMDRQSKDSIGSFHRQLNVLGRTGPSLMPPAHRLGVSIPNSGHEADGSVWPSTVSIHSPAPALRTGAHAARYDQVEAGMRTALRRSDPYFRPGACKRRRDVLMVLLCALTVTGLVGIIPAMHILLGATAIVGLALVVYVGLLIRLRNHALEREVKLRYLPRATESVSAPVRRVASR